MNTCVKIVNNTANLQLKVLESENHNNHKIETTLNLITRNELLK